jgi:Domain of unknown function (DUF4168)
MRSTLGLCAMAMAAAGLLLMPAATAQAQAPGAPSTGAPSTTKPSTKAPADISEQKLDATAAAVKKVTTIRQTYEEKVAQAPAAEKGRLVDEATTAMTKAVTDQGLSVDEYVSIIEVAQNDPGVRDKLLQKLK